MKNILITGGAGGIGLEIVHYFENKNFNIIILDKTSKKNFKTNFKKPKKKHYLFWGWSFKSENNWKKNTRYNFEV